MQLSQIKTKTINEKRANDKWWVNLFMFVCLYTLWTACMYDYTILYGADRINDAMALKLLILSSRP